MTKPSIIPPRVLVHRVLLDEVGMGKVLGGIIPKGHYEIEKVFVKGEKYVGDTEWMNYEIAFHHWKEKRRLHEYDLEVAGITEYEENPVWQSLNKKVIEAYRARDIRSFELRNT